MCSRGTISYQESKLPSFLCTIALVCVAIRDIFEENF